MGEYASFNQRILAHNIDLIVLLPVFYLIGYFVENNFLLFGLCFLTYAFYNTAMELTSWKGSIGKKMQRISVVSAKTKGETTFFQVFNRNMSKVLSTLLIFSGFLMILVDKEKRGMHDRIAGTVVIFNEK